MHRTCIVAAAAVVILSLLAGCGSTSHLPATLKPQSFRPAPNALPSQSAGGGAMQVAKAPSIADDSQISILIPPARPTTKPAVGASSGTFMYIGTVVAEVNGHPIYADKILSKVDAELSIKAPLLEPNEFREAARSAIRKQIRYDIAIEEEFAAAQRNIT